MQYLRLLLSKIRRHQLPVAGLYALALCLLTACPEDPPSDGGGGQGGEGGSPPACTIGFLGDESVDPVIEAFFWGAEDADHELADGSILDIIEPPQGGRVVFIGARVSNVDGCAALLTATLRDPNDNQVRFDTRSVNLEDAGDGFGTVHSGDLSQYSNIPVCPNLWSGQSLYDGDYRLELKLTDRAGREATSSYAVRARCTAKSQASPGDTTVLEYCECMCKAGYVLGEDCSE